MSSDERRPDPPSPRGLSDSSDSAVDVSSDGDGDDNDGGDATTSVSQPLIAASKPLDEKWTRIEFFRVFLGAILLLFIVFLVINSLFSLAPSLDCILGFHLTISQIKEGFQNCTIGEDTKAKMEKCFDEVLRPDFAKFIALKNGLIAMLTAWLCAPFTFKKFKFMWDVKFTHWWGGAGWTTTRAKNE
jgi:hypothetical protein